MQYAANADLCCARAMSALIHNSLSSEDMQCICMADNTVQVEGSGWQCKECARPPTGSVCSGCACRWSSAGTGGTSCRRPGRTRARRPRRTRPPSRPCRKTRVWSQCSQSGFRSQSVWQALQMRSNGWAPSRMHCSIMVYVRTTPRRSFPAGPDGLACTPLHADRLMLYAQILSAPASQRQ